MTQPCWRRFAILRSLLAAVVIAVLVLAAATHRHAPLSASERCATCAATLHSPSAIQLPVTPVLGGTIPMVVAVGEQAEPPAVFRLIRDSRSPPL